MALTLSMIEISTISVVFLWYILSIYLCYQAKIFWNHRKQQMISSRQPVLSLSFICIVIFQCTVIVPLQFVYYCDIAILKRNINKYYTIQLQNFLTDSFGMILINIFLLRVWFLFYDYQYNKSNFKYAFQSKIKSNSTSLKYNNFWRINRKKFGELNEITISIAILLSLPVLFILHGIQFFNISSIPYFLVDRKYHNFIAFILFLPLIILCTILSGCILPVSDSNFIRNELFIQIFILIITATSMITLFFIFKHDHYTVWFNFIWHFIMTQSFIIMAFIKSKWVLNKYKSIQINSSLPSIDTDRTSIKLFNSNSNNNHIKHNKNRLTMKLLLSSKEGFQEFAKFLQNELTLEHLLFLIEVSQFKISILEKIKNMIENAGRSSLTFTLQTIENRKIDNKYIDDNILNVSWIPLAEEISSLTPYRFGMYINQKYISDLTKYSINISFENKEKISNYFSVSNRDYNEHSESKENIYNLFIIFDSTFNEVWELLQRHSFIRFLRTPQYQKLIKLLGKQGKIKTHKKNKNKMDIDIESKYNENDEKIKGRDIDESVKIEIEYHRKKVSTNNLKDINSKSQKRRKKQVNFKVESKSHTPSSLQTVYTEHHQNHYKIKHNGQHYDHKNTEKVDKMQTIPAQYEL